MTYTKKFNNSMRQSIPLISNLEVQKRTEVKFEEVPRLRQSNGPYDKISDQDEQRLLDAY